MQFNTLAFATTNCSLIVTLNWELPDQIASKPDYKSDSLQYLTIFIPPKKYSGSIPSPCFKNIIIINKKLDMAEYLCMYETLHLSIVACMHWLRKQTPSFNSM